MTIKDLMTSGHHSRVLAAAAFIIICLSGPALAAIPSIERNALIALYNSTNGEEWADRTNWRNSEGTGFNDPGTECDWYGVTCDFGESAVVSLNLNSNELSGEIPKQLGDLSSLVTLYLHGNQLIGSIPAEFGNLENLEVLFLYSNQLSGVIPPELGNLNSIINIGFAHNELSGIIPPEIGGLSTLEQIYLNDNRLEGEIPAQIGNLSSLTILYLQSNRICGDIPFSVTGLSNLTDGIGLNLRWNAVHSDNPAVVAFLDSRQVGGDWQSTQTVAPEDLTVTALGNYTVWLSWTTVDYQYHPGGYEVFFTPSGTDSWSSVGWTESKLTTSFPATGLEPGTPYDFLVVSYTDPHPNNTKNTVFSDPSSLVTGSTTSFGCEAPIVGTTWGDPITLTALGTNIGYLWSTTETSQSIEVSPVSVQWYWVTVTSAGGCVESAAVLVDPATVVFWDGFESGSTGAWSSEIP